MHYRWTDFFELRFKVELRVCLPGTAADPVQLWPTAAFHQQLIRKLICLRVQPAADRHIQLVFPVGWLSALIIEQWIMKLFIFGDFSGQCCKKHRVASTLSIFDSQWSLQCVKLKDTQELHFNLLIFCIFNLPYLFKMIVYDFPHDPDCRTNGDRTCMDGSLCLKKNGTEDGQQ